MAINLAEKYAKKVCDKFYTESVVAGHSSNDYSFEGVKTVNIYTITTQQPGNYTRSGTSRYGTPSDIQDTYQVCQVTQDKSVALVVDKGDNTQQMMIKNAGKVMALEMREQFQPMFDKYCLAEWADKAGTKNALGQALTKSNIAEAISQHATDLMNAETTINDTVTYIGATDYAKLVLSPEFLSIDKLGEKSLGKGVVGEVRGLKIIPVPDAYMPSITVSTASKAVKFMTVKKASVLAPMQIKDMRIHQDAPGISGALLEVRWLYDAFVLTTKNKGVVVSYI